MTKQKKRNIELPDVARDTLRDIVLPEERDDYIRALRRVGWTLASIATSAGITRERVRQISSSETGSTYTPHPVPTPPLHETKKPREYVEPKPEILERLLELQPLAQQVRANSPRFRKEAEEYTALLHKAHNEDGVTLYRLGKRLGVTHSALRFRLARYGYKAPSPIAQSKSYKPVLTSNRAI